MRYEKPEMVILGSAVIAIQSGGEKDGGPNDAIPFSSVAAYEADE